MILPQSLVEMVPPFNNLFFQLLKGSALLTIIFVHEMTYQAREVLIDRNVGDAGLIWLVVLVFYLVLAILSTLDMRVLERWAARLVGRKPLGRRTLRSMIHRRAGRVRHADRPELRPEVLLLDEVTSALAPELVAGVLALLKDIAKTTDITFLCVTHEMGFARDVSDRVMMFDAGQVVEEATPEKLFTDRSTSAHARSYGRCWSAADRRVDP